MLQTLRLLTFIVVLLSIISGCSTIATDVPFVYKIDIDQGNVINHDMVNQLRPTMTKRQVIYILGTPLLVDPFSNNRWDYIYSEQPGKEDRTQQRIALFFAEDSLVHVGGDLTPEANPAPATSKEMTIDAPKRELEKTLYEIIVGWFTFDD